LTEVRAADQHLFREAEGAEKQAASTTPIMKSNPSILTDARLSACGPSSVPVFGQNYGETTSWGVRETMNIHPFLALLGKAYNHFQALAMLL